MGSFWGRGIGSKTVLGSPHIDYQLLFSEYCSISALSYSFEFLVVGGWFVVVVPSDYFVSTQLQLWLFCCWGCGCCWAVTLFFRGTDNLSIYYGGWTITLVYTIGGDG